MNKEVVSHALLAIALVALFVGIILIGMFAIDASGVARDFTNSRLADVGWPALGSVWRGGPFGL